MFLITEYEDILLKKRTRFSSKSMNKGFSNIEYLNFFLWFFEKLVEWSPEEIVQFFDYSFIQKMALIQVYKRVTFPNELDKVHDVRFISYLLYPNHFSYNQKDLILRHYNLCLSGERKHVNKNFFTGETGRYYLSVCLNYAISVGLIFPNIKELYSFFSNPKKVHVFLTKFKLKAPVYKNFNSPVEALHYCLPQEQKNDLYYYYVIFKQEYSSACKNMTPVYKTLTQNKKVNE